MTVKIPRSLYNELKRLMAFEECKAISIRKYPECSGIKVLEMYGPCGPYKILPEDDVKFTDEYKLKIPFCKEYPNA